MKKENIIKLYVIGVEVKKNISRQTVDNILNNKITRLGKIEGKIIVINIPVKTIPNLIKLLELKQL